MKHIVLISLIFLIQSAVHASVFSETHRALIDGNKEKFLNGTMDILKDDNKLVEKRGLLQVIHNNQKEFYDPQNFSSQLGVGRKEKCLEHEAQYVSCSSVDSLRLLIEKNKNTETLHIYLNKKNVLNLTLKPQISLSNADSIFGRSSHLIKNINNPKEYFLIIGTRDYSPERESVILRRLNTYKISQNESCHLSKTNMTSNKLGYELTVEFIKTLGSKAQCQTQPFIL